MHMKPSAPHSTGPCISTANSQARGNLNYKFTPTVAPNSEPKAKEKVKAKENQVEPKVTAKVAKGNETETARRVKSRRPPPIAKAGCADQTTQTQKKGNNLRCYPLLFLGDVRLSHNPLSAQRRTGGRTSQVEPPRSTLAYWASVRFLPCRRANTRPFPLNAFPKCWYYSGKAIRKPFLFALTPFFVLFGCFLSCVCSDPSQVMFLVMKFYILLEVSMTY